MIHDDVLDDAPTRRGVKTLSKSKGVDSALIAGDVMFARAMTKMASINDGYAIFHTIKAMRDMCEGQFVETSWAKTGVTPSAGEVIDAIRRKTGALMGLATRLGAHFATPPATTAEGNAEMLRDLDAVAQLGEHFGVAFQIRDDLADLAEDTANGTVTLPSLLGAEKAVQIAEKFEALSTIILE
jgi:heptaprenyl diphosphate synthase